MTMTKYEPKTDDVDRMSHNNYMRAHCRYTAADRSDLILADLTHAEACLRERDAEIERLKAESNCTQCH